MNGDWSAGLLSGANLLFQRAEQDLGAPI